MDVYRNDREKRDFVSAGAAAGKCSLSLLMMALVSPSFSIRYCCRLRCSHWWSPVRPRGRRIFLESVAYLANIFHGHHGHFHTQLSFVWNLNRRLGRHVQPWSRQLWVFLEQL